MRKLLSMILAILMIAAMMATTVAAAAEGQAPLSMTAMLVQYNQPPDPNGIYWQELLRDNNLEYNIEWVPESAYADKCALVLATGELPDVIQLTSSTDAIVVNAANNGLFKDLTPFIESGKYENLSKISASAWMNSKINGRNYIIPRSRGQYNTALFVRGDLLDKLGMEPPTTIEELTAYFRGIKELDPNMIPLPMEVNTIMDFAAGAFGDGQIVPVYTADGEGIVYERLTEAYALGVEWLQGLYKDGILAQEFALYKTDKNQDVVLAGIGGARHQNLWHRYRLSTELQKVVPDGYFTPLFYMTGDKGTTVQYDIGYYGGHAISASVPDEKVERILEFFNKTSNPDTYDYYHYGPEGVYWNMVDGFPVLTEVGKKDVTNSFFGPVVEATALYSKVDSPLADAAYNLETREMGKVIDKVAADMGHAPFHFFAIIQSPSWSEYWAMAKGDFESYVADTITGKHTIDEFRAYQAQIASEAQVQDAFKEFKASYDAFGLANWTAPVME